MYYLLLIMNNIWTNYKNLFTIFAYLLILNLFTLWDKMYFNEPKKEWEVIEWWHLVLFMIIL